MITTNHSLFLQFDEQRKSKPGFVVLRSDEECKIKSMEARKEFRAQLRLRKQRLLEATKDAPSLIERHDQAIAVSKAHHQALQRLSAAVNVTKSASGAISSDVFSHDERLKISVTTNGRDDYDYKDDYN